MIFSELNHHILSGCRVRLTFINSICRNCVFRKQTVEYHTPWFFQWQCWLIFWHVSTVPCDIRFMWWRYLSRLLYWSMFYSLVILISGHGHWGPVAEHHYLCVNKNSLFILCLCMFGCCSVLQLWTTMSWSLRNYYHRRIVERIISWIWIKEQLLFINRLI